MPKSKNNSSHKTRLEKFKSNQKNMSEQSVQQPMPQYPPVRTIPVWPADAVITITGQEWEALQNGLSQLQGALQAGQAIMSRHIIQGVIGMEFEKLDPATLTYGPMTAEEKAPYIEDFKRAVEAIKNPPAPQAAEAKSTIVNAEGEAVTSEPEVTTEAKVVKMGSKKGK